MARRLLQGVENPEKCDKRGFLTMKIDLFIFKKRLCWK